MVLEAQQQLMRERPPHTHGRASGPSREQGFPHVSSGANALFLFKLAAAGGTRRRRGAPYSIGLALVYYSHCCMHTELAIELCSYTELAGFPTDSVYAPMHGALHFPLLGE